METNTPKPNLQDLQKDVIELLGKISDLMGRASHLLGSKAAGKNYIRFQGELNKAAKNVKDLALRMAIVAPMKSGKSTIINSVIGQDLLPSRNAAMTTLPTEIIFDETKSEPILLLNPENSKVFQEAILGLKGKIAQSEKGALEKLGEYPHLVPLFNRIREMPLDYIPEQINGCKDIIRTLAELNDLIRLCNILTPNVDPLRFLDEVPRIYTPFWQNKTAEQSENLGNLVIIDTPGPNEAGENLKLKYVVQEELQKSSLVLIVLDFTQLKTEAAEKVRRDVQKVISLRGIDNLYVLINKVDQRRSGDMTSTEVRQFVSAEFGLLSKNQIFEVAARWAFSAASFLLELQQNPQISISEMKTAPALAQEVYGIDWEEELAESTVEELEKKAKRLWKKSGFPPFLDEAITALMERAAPKSMRSSLEIARQRLRELHNGIAVQNSDIAKDEKKLRQEIEALDADLKRLELCRTRMRDVEKIKSNLNKELDQLLQSLKRKSSVSIENIFSKEEYQQAGLAKKTLLIFNKFISLVQRNNYKGTGEIEFKCREDADDFIEQVVICSRYKTEAFLDNARPEFEAKIDLASQKIIAEVKQVTRPIIEQADQRLNETFNLNLPPSFSTLQIEFVDQDVQKPQVQEHTRWIDQGYETQYKKKRSWHHWLWLVPYEKEIQVKRPDKREDYYTVSLAEIVRQVNIWIEESVQSIHKNINQYLDADFQEKINDFFETLDQYLMKYRDDLKQAQENQQLSLEQKKQLVENLQGLAEEVPQYLEEAETFLDRTQEFETN